MTDAVLPATLAGRLADLEARIRNLETSPRLRSAAIRSGTLRVLDSNGAAVGQLGDLGGNYNGLLVASPATGLPIVLATDVAGLAVPYLGNPWRKVTDTVPVASATFVTTHDARLEILSSNALRFVVSVACDAGTTGELQVVFGSFVTAGSVLGSPFAISAASADYEFSIQHGGVLESGPFRVRLQARRTAGAGNVVVSAPWGVYLGGAAGSGGGFPTPAGGWQIV